MIKNWEQFNEGLINNIKKRFTKNKTDIFTGKVIVFDDRLGIDETKKIIFMTKDIQYLNNGVNFSTNGNYGILQFMDNKYNKFLVEEFYDILDVYQQGTKYEVLTNSEFYEKYEDLSIEIFNAVKNKDILKILESIPGLEEKANKQEKINDFNL